ncbi:hypothetical protein [Halobacillus sp. A5]|uniref:hypothetical protein n=1 Tax=Halobacillus sp. A5 TaxID=2880263 RepID=UPI0020A64062|nr:hypothetical protein [Halobacillus sp. A5]MCP3028214.1 hypothetical protein [Halobacillus sp. A5]
MHQPLIVTETFDHIFNAAYSQLTHTISFNKFETISLNGTPHYIEPLGWYVPLISNNSSFHMSSAKLEEYYEQGFVTTYDDLVLKKNYCQFKVNQSLDLNEKNYFTKYAAQLNDTELLLQEYEKSRTPVAN